MKNKFLVVKKIIGNFLEPGAYKTYGTQTKNNKGNHNETMQKYDTPRSGQKGIHFRRN